MSEDLTLAQRDAVARVNRLLTDAELLLKQHNLCIDPVWLARMMHMTAQVQTKHAPEDVMHIFAQELSKIALDMDDTPRTEH